MSSTSALLATITEMQTRLLEVQQQLATQLQREAAKGAPMAPAVAPTAGPVAGSAPSVMPRGRIPYSYPGSHATMNTAIRLQSPESLYSPSAGLSHGGHPSGGSRGGHSRGGPSGSRGAVRGGRGGGYSGSRGLSHGVPREDAVHGGAVRGRGGRGGRGGVVHAVRDEAKDERKETVELDALLALHESVFFHIIVKKDSEGKLVYATCRSTFDGSVLTVVESEAAPSLIGHQSNKPGVLLYQFMDALKASGQLKRSFTIAPWKLCYVVREGQRHTLESLLFEALGKGKGIAIADAAVADAVVASKETSLASVATEPVLAIETQTPVVASEVVPSTPLRKTKPKMKKAVSEATVSEATVSEATVSEAVSEAVAAAPEVEAMEEKSV